VHYAAAAVVYTVPWTKSIRKTNVYRAGSGGEENNSTMYIYIGDFKSAPDFFFYFLRNNDNKRENNNASP